MMMMRVMVMMSTWWFKMLSVFLIIWSLWHAQGKRHSIAWKFDPFNIKGFMQEPVDNKVTLLGGSRKRWYLFIMHQSIPTVPSQQRPPPPPGLLRGICPPCQSWGWGICKFCSPRGPGICQPWGHSRAFDTHVVFYQNITTQKVLLEKKADWLICQGQE